jgi:Fur family ferric uptake transcriptional regulator
MDNNKAKYEMIHENEHCHHLICIGCTKIVKIEDCPFKELEKTLHNRTDFDVTGHKLEVYGYCPDCKKGG